LREAIAQARRDGALRDVADVIDWPGFRRRLVSRIAGWTRAERSVEADSPRDDPLVRAQWAIHVRYRATLERLDAEDAEGFATWASRRLIQKPPRALKKLGQVNVLEPALSSRAVWRALEHFPNLAKSVRVTLAYDPQPALAEAYAEAAAIRQRLLSAGYAETIVALDLWRPKALRDVVQEVFRSDVHRRPRLTDANGLTILGAPQGEGLGLVVARQVRRLLDLGTDPSDVLVLFRRWDGDADLVLETLQAWGIRAAAERPRLVSGDPVVAALQLALRLPVDDWETAPLIQLLRNGQVRPAWSETLGSLALATAALVLQATRVFRGIDPIRKALDRVLSSERSRTRTIERTRLARDVVDRFVALLESLNESRPWHSQVDELERVARSLRLGSTGDRALDQLREALADQGATWERLGRGDRPWSWSEFVRDVESICGDLTFSAPPTADSSVRLATVDDVEGACAPWVILANLGEGTFPIPDAVNLSAPVEQSDAETGVADSSYARELAKFLRVVGSAERGLVLVYPTTDPQGQELLRAGFLDEVLDRFAPEIADGPPLHESYRRFDPALEEWPELAGAPADSRARAVALACAQREDTLLADLSRQPKHRAILEGSAAALRVAHSRLQTTQFGVYDGMLDDPRAVAGIVKKFGPQATFSPSQLESFLFCPFQFFGRYVLKLKPVDERDELEEDYAERGSRIHGVLENLELMRASEPRDRLELAESAIRNALELSEVATSSDVESGLQEIERRRMARIIRRYARQHESYEALAPDALPVPHRFEVVFGLTESDSTSYPELVLGAGPATVRLQGKIDRIDLVPAQSGFRVIDYKTGSWPSKKDVKESLFLQLPLYALAVERIILAQEAAQLYDVGYWALAGDGFKPIALKDWEHDREALEAFVIQTVAQLRQGVFAVDSRKDDCTSYCEFSAVCRVRQARAAGKLRENVPNLELKTS
jgi:RecB family exonuclease